MFQGSEPVGGYYADTYMMSVARVHRRALLGGLAVVATSAAGLAVVNDRLLVPIPPNVRRIGFLGSSSEVDLGRVDGLRQGLRDYGWAEGQNIAIEYRFLQRNEQAARLVAELVQARVELLFAGDSVAALAAKNATDTLPVVFAGVTDPVCARAGHQSWATRR
jgi:putative ABC transport system substrate-binding protein